MQNKKLITGIIIVVAIVALVLVAKSLMSACKHKSVPISTVGAKGAPAAKMPAKKMISKGKGALTVKLLNPVTSRTGGNRIPGFSPDNPANLRFSFRR